MRKKKNRIMEIAGLRHRSDLLLEDEAEDLVGGDDEGDDEGGDDEGGDEEEAEADDEGGDESAHGADEARWRPRGHAGFRAQGARRPENAKREADAAAAGGGAGRPVTTLRGARVPAGL